MRRASNQTKPPPRGNNIRAMKHARTGTRDLGCARAIIRSRLVGAAFELRRTKIMIRTTYHTSLSTVLSQIVSSELFGRTPPPDTPNPQVVTLHVALLIPQGLISCIRWGANRRYRPNRIAPSAQPPKTTYHTVEPMKGVFGKGPHNVASSYCRGPP